MYNASTLKTNLLSLIGWRQNLDPAGTQLLKMTTSDSGMFFNDEHPLLNFDMLFSLAQDFTNITPTTWSGATAYVVGDLVTKTSIIYECVSAHENQTPPNATYWRVMNLFSVWIQNQTMGSAIRAVQKWIGKKTDLGTSRNLLERSTLFTQTGNVSDTHTSENKVVGLEILPARFKGLKVKIISVGTQFDANENPIGLKLFKSGTLTANQTLNVNYAGAGSVQWDTVDWELDPEGSYLLCYDEVAITASAINGVKDYTRYWQGLQYFPSGRYFQATAFNTGESISALWDLSTNIYTLSTNYGLNLKLWVGCDYTDLISEQKDQFKTAISKQVAIDMLQLIGNNPSAIPNRFANIVDWDKIQYIVNGERSQSGLMKELNDAIESIQFDMTDIDPVCLPCRRRAVQIDVIG